ncbi:MAG: hypothetical protein LBV45_00645 [Xanthomonadaceae bacterium]|nr:hypothetical protein [Xanthomonadaceae bacterium]
MQRVRRDGEDGQDTPRIPVCIERIGLPSCRSMRVQEQVNGMPRIGIPALRGTQSVSPL